MLTTNTVFLLLGSNEGNRLKWLQKAILSLQEKAGLVTQCSSVYETSAWGIEDQNAFYNLVLVLKTTQSPFELLINIQKIEQECGRQRIQNWGARTLDIDILYFNNETIETKNLKIPHPFIGARKFTLVPLVELAPCYIHPILQKTNEQILFACKDELSVQKITSDFITSF